MTVPSPLDSLSIVIPTRRLDASLRGRIQVNRERLPAREIIVVEPDDLEGRAAVADAIPGGRLVRAPRGRGTQCNGGARAATGELLMFLHDDTLLPADAEAALQAAFADQETEMACFRLDFDRRHWLLRVYAYCSRFESLLTTFGDQAMILRRTLFDAVGGFPDWPLFEDVELARRVRRRSRICKLPTAVTTSATRFETNGMLSQQFANGVLLARFLLGAPPQRLAATYERRRQGPSREGAS